MVGGDVMAIMMRVLMRTEARERILAVMMMMSLMKLI